VVPKKDGGKKQKLDTIVIVDDSKEVAELKRKLKEISDQLTSMVVPSLPVPAQPVPVISAQLPIPPLPVPPFSGPPLPQICPPIQMPVPTVPLPSSPAMPPYSCEASLLATIPASELFLVL
jgi:hypothetical protein